MPAPCQYGEMGSEVSRQCPVINMEYENIIEIYPRTSPLIMDPRLINRPRTAISLHQGQNIGHQWNPHISDKEKLDDLQEDLSMK